MSQDYRIVFQVETTATAVSAPSTPTIPAPKVDTSVAPKAEDKTSTIGVQQVMSAIGNPIGTAMGKLAGAIPWVAVALAVAKTADNLVSTTVDMLSASTGDSSGELAYANFKLGFGHALRPVSYGVALWKQQIEIDRQNKGIAQQRLLMGNGTTNGIGKVGV